MASVIRMTNNNTNLGTQIAVDFPHCVPALYSSEIVLVLADYMFWRSMPITTTANTITTSANATTYILHYVAHYVIVYVHHIQYVTLQLDLN